LTPWFFFSTSVSLFLVWGDLKNDSNVSMKQN
jgi:hypothetical protein